MARYTSLFTIATPAQRIQDLLRHTLEACNLDVIYDSGDYVVAREKPGQVSYAQLVTAEVLIDRSKDHGTQAVRLNFVVKNEELPLQMDNHCHRIFDQLNTAIAANESWHLIETVA